MKWWHWLLLGFFFIFMQMQFIQLDGSHGYSSFFFDYEDPCYDVIYDTTSEYVTVFQADCIARGNIYAPFIHLSSMAMYFCNLMAIIIGLTGWKKSKK